MAKTEHGYFLIADITGYTHFLSASELEHAHEILQTLMELLIQHTRPPLIISRLAGDAVISYGLKDNFVAGQTFLEMIEDTYVAFRRAINLMVLNTSCDCKACANINTLDLKFFVHYGSFTRQRLDSHDELLGADVIVIHRLLKNNVTEKTGCRTAYSLYTDTAIRQLGIEDVCSSMTEHIEVYEHLGEIKTWIQDMHPVWLTKQESLKIVIPPDQISAQASRIFPVPVEMMWEMITQPHFRAPLMGAVTQNILNRQEGRIAPGSQFHCFHGDGRETTQTILEWHPFEQMTTEDTTPVPRTTCLVNLKLEPVEKDTRLTISISRAKGPFLLRHITDLVARTQLPKVFQNGLENMAAILESEISAGKHKLPHPAEIPTDHIHQAITTSLNES